MPAVWHDQTAWLCLRGMAQPFIDKLAQSVMSPGHPVSPSKIRLDAANPSVQVTLGFRKCPWLNINKGLICGTYVAFSKMYVSPDAFNHQPAYFHTAVPTALAFVSLACQK